MTRPVAAALVLVAGLSLLATAPRAAERPALLETGQPMPRLTGRTLGAHESVLPDAARGRVTLVLVGFSYASRKPVQAWAERFRARFGADSTVTLFEVPMIGGMARMAARFIESGMRKGTPRELHDRVLIVYGDTRPWKARMGWEAKARDDAYLMVLDRGGVVRWREHGLWDEASFGRLVAAVEGLRGSVPSPGSPDP